MPTKSRYDVVISEPDALVHARDVPGQSRRLVLLLDKDRLPSDQVLSTHTIHPPGLDILDDVGVGAAVRAVAPPTRIVRLRKNDAFVDIEFPATEPSTVLAVGGSTASCTTRPRRRVWRSLTRHG